MGTSCSFDLGSESKGFDKETNTVGRRVQGSDFSSLADFCVDTWFEGLTCAVSVSKQAAGKCVVAEVASIRHWQQWQLLF